MIFRLTRFCVPRVTGVGSGQRLMPPAIALLLILVLSAGCGDDVTEPVTPSPSPAVFVANSLAETLSRYLIASGETATNALVLGAYPNDIVIGPDATTGYVVSSGDNRIDVVDLDQLTIRRTIDLRPGASPYALALVGAEDAYVSNWASDDVAHVNLTDGTVLDRIPVGRGPEGVLFVADGARAGAGPHAATGDLYVAISNFLASGDFGPGEVVVVSVPADTVRARIPVGINPQSLSRAPDGTVHVACSGDYHEVEGWVFIIDPQAPAAVDSLFVGGSPVALLPLAGGPGFTAGYEGGLRIYDPGSRRTAEANALRGAGFFSNLAYDPATDLLYVSDFDDDCVHVVAVNADTLVGSFPTGDGPVALAIRR